MSRSNARSVPRLSLLCCAVLLHGAAVAENVDPAGGGAQFAWGENVGWLNAEPQGDGGPGVEVDDTALTGWIWAENAGWISLSCENTASCASNAYKVVNDGKGNLSGHAWGENIGWISFRTSTGSSCCVNNGTPGCTDSACEAAICAVDPYCCNGNWDQTCADEASASSACSTSCATTPYGVRVHGFTGVFSGQAWAENAGWINFGTMNPGNPTQVKTGWQCPDDDFDGVCAASDNCPIVSNPSQGTVLFDLDVRAPNKTQFTWPTPVPFELVTGTFTTPASIGAWNVDFYDTGCCTVFTDAGMPNSGQGYWYLFRPNCPVGSYSTGSPAEFPGRDEALIP